MKHSLIKWIFSMLIIATATPIHLHSAIYRVKTNGSDSGDGSNWTTQAMSNRKFAQALLAAQAGDIFQL
ncbi:MAG: hypothetical protein LBC19_16330, partial [Tannerella sp.]|nr:hypothetical protein [Tannerella sp.]